MEAQDSAVISQILVVKLSSLGDVVHTLPAVEALRRRFPEARIAWAVERAHAGVLGGSPLVDELIEWDRGKSGGYRDFVRRLRARRYDLAIDFQGLLRSAFTTYLSGARRRLGFAPERERSHWFYNERAPMPTAPMHAVERSLRLVETLGATLPGVPLVREYLQGNRKSEIRNPKSSPSELFPLPIGTGDRRAVDDWLRDRRIDLSRRRLVILNPHCRNEANLWPATNFAELAARLVEHDDVQIVLTGGVAARGVCDVTAQGLGDRIARADGALSILGSAELIRRAALFITGDTGPMHLAAAVGAPIVALFGPTDPVRTGPYSTDVVALRKRMHCAPCRKRNCPLGFTEPPCMTELTVDAVYAAVVARLAADENFAGRRIA